MELKQFLSKQLIPLLQYKKFPGLPSTVLSYKYEEVLAFFQGPKFFNSLDNKVINSQSLSSFKKKLKIKLLSKYENSL